MIVICTLVILFSAFFTFKMYIRGIHKNLSLFDKYFKPATAFFFISWLLLLPFDYSFNTYFLRFTISTIIIGYVIKANAKKEYETDTEFKSNFYRYGLLPVTLITAYLYLPLLMLDYFKYYSLEKMILYPVLVLIIVSVLLFLPAFLKSKVKLVVSTVFSVILMALAITGFVTILKPQITTVDGELRLFDIYDDYYSSNVLSVKDGTKNGEIREYYYDDTFVYYIVDDDSYTFKVYDYISETLVFSYKLDENSRFGNWKFQDIIVHTENTIYCFLNDGVYIYYNGSLIKQNTFDINDTSQFIYNDTFYFEYYDENLDTKQMYKVTDTIEATNEFDEIEAYVIKQNRILEIKDNSVRFYDSSDPRWFEALDYLNYIMNDTHALNTNYEVTMASYNRYIHELIDIDGNTEVYTNRIHVDSQNLMEFNGLYYTSRNQIFSYYKPTFVDENFSKVATYNLGMFNKDFEGSISPRINEIDNQLTYLTTNHAYDDDTNLLYFEVNMLHEQETILPFDYHSPIFPLAFFFPFTLMVIFSNSIKSFLIYKDSKVVNTPPLN